MATQTLATIPVKNQGNGEAKTALGAMPAGLVFIEINIQATTGNPASPFTGFQRPFNSPNMSINFGIDFSWDGGTTFPQSSSATQQGSATGTWGTDRHGNPVMTPNTGLGLPSDANGNPPNAFRLTETVTNGPITYGLTVTGITA